MARRLSLQDFLASHCRVVQIALTRVRGSSPREVGTCMFVAADGLWGTIGGGQLEYIAIDHARRMLKQDVLSDTLDVPLGPEIGQCCGGRVEMSLAQMRQPDRAAAVTAAKAEEQALPHVYVMGAGHVGRALADLFQHMPLRCILIDQRSEELNLCQADVEIRQSAIPEIDIATAPAGSAFVVLTHDHALDFLLASAALQRGDAGYVGLIGSATKREKFRRWCRDHCDGLGTDRLICPIGAGGSRDKRPSVIAAFVAAEVIADLTSETAASTPARGTDLPETGKQPDAEGDTAGKISR
ncbi:xanthine dehydrogenase accessory protein XdhC [Leisingera methylohalidivorans]|uniref:Xanthine dehydrogenase accessory protein XdhC n=1 Tax=Leisingera methylohalidivorans DSM 14336 TaxID=999552 RepID=V9W186_9RHOB|nr:xanthine dehydrogenase accessory protein XdhC [Leisingera methylohalidivorans]AHD03744.1 xanthine dehydrogenase accessory protein XdhC [Leisingera methylohalidivorans DSM 14336]